MNQPADAGQVRRPRLIATATALLGSVTSLVALALPWWSASGRSATPTANGLFPILTMSLVVLAVVGVDTAVRMCRNSGTAAHALITMAITVLPVVAISFYALDGWGEATRGYGQVAALVGATAVVATTTLGLASAGSSTPSRAVGPGPIPPPQNYPPHGVPGQPPAPIPSQPATTPPLTTPPTGPLTTPLTAPPVAASIPVTPQQSPESPSTSFWFRVEVAEPLFGPDGVNAISLLQPGRWYLAVGLAPGWVIAQDGNGGTGYVNTDKIVRDAR